LEPVTHFLFGACLGRAGFNRTTALATATMTLAAEAPDLDILWYAGGPLVGFAHHRGFTHSFLGAPLVAALVVAFMYGLHRWREMRRQTAEREAVSAPAAAGNARKRLPPRWGLLYLYALLAAWSHLLLDFTNGYGVRPFWPFYEKWYSWDIVFIIEPLLYVAMVGGLVLPALFGLINEEIGVRHKGPRGRGGAIVALVAVVVVWGVRDFEHRRAVAALQALTYQGGDPVRASAFPYLLNPFKWYGVVETEEAFFRMQVNSLRPEVDPQGRMLVRYKPEETPASLAAKESRLGRVYLDWAEYPVVDVAPRQPPGSGWVVQFHDLRFLYPERPTPVLAATVVLDENRNVVVERFGRREQLRRLESPGGASQK
jgi:inner membrane protein